MEELRQLLEQILQNQKEHKEAIQALYDRIEKLHDPVLQAYLEQAVQIKPAPPSLEELVKKATKKTS